MPKLLLKCNFGVVDIDANNNDDDDDTNDDNDDDNSNNDEVENATS